MELRLIVHPADRMGGVCQCEESTRLWAVSAVSAEVRMRAKEATTRAETGGTPGGGMASGGVHLES